MIQLSKVLVLMIALQESDLHQGSGARSRQLAQTEPAKYRHFGDGDFDSSSSFNQLWGESTKTFSSNHLVAAGGTALSLTWCPLMLMLMWNHTDSRDNRLIPHHARGV